MSRINVSELSHASNGGDPNIELYADGSTSLRNFKIESINGGPLGGFKNQLISGDFSVAQRGDDFFSTAPAATDDPYTLDRWCVASIGAAQPTRVVRQNNDAPPGFAWSVALSASGTPAGATRQSLMQGVELQRPGNNSQFVVGSTWTLSFWIKSIANSSITVSAGFRPSVQTGGPSPAEFNDTVNSTTSWAKVSRTFTIANTADASDECLAVIFYNGVATNTSILLAGVQLEPGPISSEYEYRAFGTELQLCQRYYEQSFPYGTKPENGPSGTAFVSGSSITRGQALNRGANGQTFNFVVSKRVTPVIQKYGNNAGHWRVTTQVDGNSYTWNNNVNVVPRSNNSFMVDQQVFDGQTIWAMGHWTASAEF